MYKTPSVNESAKYTVAAILSSMASGETYSVSSSNTVTATKDLLSPSSFLTPSTLFNIEQSFINLQPADETAGHSESLHSQSGFIPPLPESTSSSHSENEVRYSRKYSSEYGTDDEDTSCSDPDWSASVSAKRPRIAASSVAGIDDAGYLITASGRRTGPRRPRDEKLTPEEEARRHLRRERNKLAAAKCRQRRVDHTNRLLKETEALEDDKSKLESEIQTLQQQKEQLEFILQAHKATCLRNQSTRPNNQALMIKPEPKETPSRPTTLPLVIKPEPESTPPAMNSLGIIISTPSTGLFGTLGLDSMVDGHTGLTPLTGVVTTSVPTPSCATDMPKNLTKSSDDLSSPSSLMAL